jgi:hypothetical protein
MRLLILLLLLYSIYSKDHIIKNIFSKFNNTNTTKWGESQLFNDTKFLPLKLFFIIDV